MKKSTKLIMTGAASLLGVALAAGGAYATTGMSALDAPGQLLKISGIAPAAAHANHNALEHANKNAKGLFNSTPKAPKTDTEGDADADATTNTDVDASTDTDAPTAATPVAPRDAAANASTVKGSETGQSVSAWAHEKNSVEVVTPPAAVSLKSDTSVGAETSANARSKH